MDKKIVAGLLLTLVVIAFTAAYWATEPTRHSSAKERQRLEAMARGAELYSTTCALCHGSRGEGKIGPALKGIQLDEDALRKAIARGRPGTAMPAWSEEDGGPLTKHQIGDLGIFIRNWDDALLEKVAASLPATPTPTPRPTVVPTATVAPSAPDLAASGKVTFFESGCIGCHRINGEGGAVGPPLVGVFGSERELATGEKVLANEDYMEESIRNPGVKVVKGYEPIMPKLDLGAEQVEALIDFIRSLGR